MPNARRVQAIVDGLIDHGDGVYSVWLKTGQSATNFRPGQFLHLALDDFSPEEGYWPESRVFSIASAPGGDAVRIVYAIKGEFTKRMSRELVQGKPVWLKLPFGDFVVRVGSELLTQVLVAGGTGITPFVPLLCAGKMSLKSFWLYYGVRKASLMIFQNELKEARGKAELNLDVRSEEDFDKEDYGIPIRPGKLDIQEIAARHGSDASTHYYLSGPFAMIQSFRSQLASKAVSARNIHVDDWQ